MSVLGEKNTAAKGERNGGPRCTILSKRVISNNTTVNLLKIAKKVLTEKVISEKELKKWGRKPLAILGKVF